MKWVIILFAGLHLTSAVPDYYENYNYRPTTQRSPTCPPVRPDEYVYPCVYNSRVNCAGDYECPHGHNCCPGGCGKVCRDLRYPQQVTTAAPTRRTTTTRAPHRPQCPPDGAAPINCGPTVVPYGCQRDSQCPYRQLCCPEKCTQICKPEVQPSRPTPRPVCPHPPPNNGGHCVRDPSRNCVQNSNCPNGQLCCPGQCGRQCMSVGRSSNLSAGNFFVYN